MYSFVLILGQVVFWGFFVLLFQVRKLVVANSANRSLTEGWLSIINYYTYLAQSFPLIHVYVVNRLNLTVAGNLACAVKYI